MAVAHIPLTRGLVALVDLERYDELAQYRWQAAQSRKAVYARRVDKQFGYIYITSKPSNCTVTMQGSILFNVAVKDGAARANGGLGGLRGYYLIPLSCSKTNNPDGCVSPLPTINPPARVRLLAPLIGGVPAAKGSPLLSL